MFAYAHIHETREPEINHWMPKIFWVVLISWGPRNDDSISPLQCTRYWIFQPEMGYYYQYRPSFCWVQMKHYTFMIVHGNGRLTTNIALLSFSYHNACETNLYIFQKSEWIFRCTYWVWFWKQYDASSTLEGHKWWEVIIVASCGHTLESTLILGM